VISAILDSTTLVEESFATQWSANLQRSLDVLYSECSASASCNEANPDLEQTFYALITEMNESPRSLTLEVDGEEMTLAVTGDRFAAGIANGLYVADLIPLLPLAITATASGANFILEQFGPALVPDVSTFDYGHYASVLCAEEVPFDTPESLADAQAGVEQELVDSWGAVNGSLFLQLCDFWEVDPRPDLESQPVQSDIPSLVLSGQYDPATPPSYGARAADNLANSQYFVFTGVGHGVLRAETAETELPRCAQRIVMEFLDDPTASVDGSCAEALPPAF